MLPVVIVLLSPVHCKTDPESFEKSSLLPFYGVLSSETKRLSIGILDFRVTRAHRRSPRVIAWERGVELILSRRPCRKDPGFGLRAPSSGSGLGLRKERSCRVFVEFGNG